MKKLLILTILVLSISLKAQAINVADIPTIQSVAAALSSDASNLQRLADQMKVLADSNFVVQIADGAESFALTNQQKLNILAKYTAIKAQMQTDFNQLP